MGEDVMDEIKQLNEIGQIITGNTPKTSDERNYNSNDICFVKPSDMEESKLVTLTDTEAHIAEYARSKARILPKRSVLVTCIGIIGKVAVNEMECAFNQQINAIVPDEKICHYKFLGYALLAKKKMIQDMANAPVVPILNKSQFSNVKIKVPSIKEQLRMVACLEAVDKLIDKRNQEIEKLDELVKSRFIEMFGDPVTNPKKWDKKALTFLGSCKNGMNFHQNDIGIKINCLGVGDFKNLDKITETNHLPFVSLNDKPSTAYMLQDEDIVFVRSNGNKALVGRCLAVYPKDIPTTFSGFCIRFRQYAPKLVNTDYLLAVLKTNGIRSQMVGRGANIQNLNQQLLSKIEIPISPMELQNEFADFVKSTDKSKLAIQKSLDDLETLKKSLMQQYFG